MHDEQSQPSPDEVKIRLKHRDWEVEITCLESKVKQVVENVLSGIDNSYTNIDPTLNNQLTEIRKEIDSLKLQINSGSINQIQAINTTELQRKAIPTRLGTMRNYQYIQKRPPSESPF